MYLVVLKDRRIDDQYALFKDLIKAIDYARDLAKASCKHKSEYKEQAINGWLFHANYSLDGDCVYVEQLELSD